MYGQLFVGDRKGFREPVRVWKSVRYLLGKLARVIFMRELPQMHSSIKYLDYLRAVLCILSYLRIPIKMTCAAWDAVAQWLEHRSTHPQRVIGLIPGQGYVPGLQAQSLAQVGACARSK